MDFGCRRAYMDYHEFILTRVVSWADVEAAAAPLPPPCTCPRLSISLAPVGFFKHPKSLTLFFFARAGQAFNYN